MRHHRVNVGENSWVAGAILILLLAASCSKKENKSPLPRAIGGLALQHEVSGPEARSRIGRLHGRTVAPTASFIGHYGTGPDHAMLYVSKFGSGSKANKVLRDMSERIGEGSSGFGHHTVFTVTGEDIHLVLGQGQVHYFFSRDRYLYWLAINRDMARAALSELLGVDLEAIPEPTVELYRP